MSELYNSAVKNLIELIKQMSDTEFQHFQNVISCEAELRRSPVRTTPRYERTDNTDQYETRGAQVGPTVCDTVEPQQELPEKWKERLHVSDSGATSSHVPLRYDLIPRSLIEIAARRYTEGAKIHGERGYQVGLGDRDFILNRINHIQEHWNALFHSSKYRDAPKEGPIEHLGAILWGIGFLCELIEHELGAPIIDDICKQGRVRNI